MWIHWRDQRANLVRQFRRAVRLSQLCRDEAIPYALKALLIIGVSCPRWRMWTEVWGFAEAPQTLNGTGTRNPP